MHVRIAGSGYYTPTDVITNAELVERFGLDVDPEWIRAITGIESRHWMTADQSTSDMAAIAAQRILDDAGVAASEVDQIVLETVSPDYLSPSTATIVARHIGARCMAYDLSAACAGFLYGLDIGANAILAGGAKNVLVLSAGARSRFVDPANRRSLVLFADAAAGVLLQASDTPGILGRFVGAEGSTNRGAYVPAGGARLPASAETVARGQHYVHVDPMRGIFEVFERFTLESCHEALRRAGCSLDDIDLFITHQGNSLLVKRLAAALGFPLHKTVDSIAHHGNVSGTTVPLALAEQLEAGRIQPGHKVLLTSVGAGYTFGAVVHQF